MSSNKSKDKIQKKVEASILDAVTKFKSDEISLNNYEKSEQIEVQSILIGDKSAQVLWDLANEKPTSTLNDANLVDIDDPIQKIDNTKNNESKNDFKSELKSRIENEELKTVAIDIQTKKGSESIHLPPLPETMTSYPGPNNQINLLQYKLYEGEHLKIAQKKIEELESSIEKLRIDNEKLATASELFQKKSDEALSSKLEIEKKLNFNEDRFSEERISLKTHIEQREQTIKELRDKIELLETRLSDDIRKSRSKERELENRLELARLEKISLVGSKDDIILDLKRQVDQLNHELGNYRRKTAQMNQTLEANQEQFRRTVRALRLALTNLEVNDPVGGQIKKAE